MKTINPTEAPAVFVQAKMRPVQHVTYDPNRLECDLIMALYIRGIGGIPPTKIPAKSLAGALGFTKWYACGLIYGWDGFGEADVVRGGRMDWDEIRLGIEHGREAWYQCDKAGQASRQNRQPMVSV